MKNYSKYIGLLLCLTGGVVLMINKSVDAELPLLVGLFILFISKERHEDERSIQVKASSALMALILGYALKLIISNLYIHQIISFDLISINFFLIIVFGFANLIRFFRLYIFMG